MGIYDYVLGMQFKGTLDPRMHNYVIGEQIDVADGAYICFEGVFIVKEGRIIAGSETVFDKWGGPVNCYEVLNPSNPVSLAIDHLDKNLDKDLKKKIKGFDEDLNKSEEDTNDGG